MKVHNPPLRPRNPDDIPPIQSSTTPISNRMSGQPPSTRPTSSSRPPSSSPSTSSSSTPAMSSITTTLTLTTPPCVPRPPPPLPTPFTLPASCNATLYLTSYALTTTSFPSTRPTHSISPVQTLTQTDLSIYGVAALFATITSGPRGLPDDNCYPPGFDVLRLNWARNQNDGGECWPTYYSPGVCPADWTGAGGTKTREKETGVTCCPPGGWTVPVGVGGVPVYCERLITTPTSAWDADGATWRAISTGTLRAEGVEVRWSEGDFDTSSGLSIGAKAGIGVGVGLGTIGLGAAVLAGWVLSRRKGKKAVEKGDDRVGLKAEMDGVEVRPPVEVHGDGSRPELVGDGGVVEMPAEERAGELESGGQEEEKDKEGKQGRGRFIAELEG